MARFILQEFLSNYDQRFKKTDWLPGNLIASGVVVICWGYFIYSGSVATIWPMFGTANQLLAGIALTIGTSYIINRGKVKYAWITMVPMAFIIVITFVAGFLNIKGIYLPQVFDSAHRMTGIINLTLTLVIMISAVIIMKDSIPQWIKAIRERK